MAGTDRAGKPATVHWFPVVGVLFALPLILAFVLSRWLGTPSEAIQSERVLSPLGLVVGDGSQYQGLEYSGLVFVRVDLSVEDLESWLQVLSGFPIREATVEEPISLKIDRPWWDPPAQTPGRMWEIPGGFLWSSIEAPQTCYLVLMERKEP